MENTSFILVLLCLILPCSSLVLDDANLQALNRDVRTALLQKISNTLSSANNQMNYQSSQTQNCQSQLSGAFDACAACVKDACDHNFQNCHEKKPVTLCDVTGTNYKVCRAIMNSESLALDATSDFDGKMRKVMRRMVQDQEAHILTFLKNIKSFMDSSLRSAGSGPIRKSLESLITYYGTVKTAVDAGIHHNAALQNSLNSMSDVMKQGMESAGVQMSSATGNFMTELAFNLARMLATNNPTFGRRKRQATTCSTIRNFPAHCFSAFQTECPCTGHSPSAILNLCGAHLQSSIAAIAKPIQTANEIFDRICVQEDLIQKVNYENVAVDRHNLGYNIVKYSAAIRGINLDFTAQFQLRILNLPRTASEMAEAIWGKWVKKINLV
ncbi:uncharacterized protein LOC117318161 [Pecten maximus]|uniref:uncharacterized protein LOC117318161 n=1 Tax=Pecten maximus TaxID=6579 RepID=UPI00145852B4|nr:uncharacterized protein LOC117318161 [Pecten maximus]